MPLSENTPHKLGNKCIDCGQLIGDKATRCQKCYRKQSSWSKTGKSLELNIGK